MVHMMRVRAASTGWTGGPGLNTFYFQTPTLVDPVTADATNVVARVRAAFVTAVALWPTPWSVQVLNDVDVIDSATGDLVDYLNATGVAIVVGTNAANFGPIASGLCVAITTLSFVNGHRVQGRAFLSPLAAGADPNGSPTATYITKGEQFISDLRNFGGGGPELVVWHRPVGGAGGQACQALGEICRDKFSVLRSRRD